jgi:ATP-dependent DNA helicase RecQ
LRDDTEIRTDFGLTSLGVCVSLDLEVDPSAGRVLSFAATRGGEEKPLVHSNGELGAALPALDTYCRGADFLVGHNIIDHDLAHLAAADDRLALLKLPVIDTLRLNPLAFPRNPYHRLVKHYRDGRLLGGGLNDPELDARITLELLSEQIEALRRLDVTSPDLTLAFHALTAGEGAGAGFDAIFRLVRKQVRPYASELEQALSKLLSAVACRTRAVALCSSGLADGWSLAYALAWISVSGGDSVMPPWVRHRFPRATELVRELRNSACTDPHCTWCREQNDPDLLLDRWFGFEAFRPEPAGPTGEPLQREIVAKGLAGESQLGILPTGTGKSVCYQLPALSRYEKTGALTVVISPLVALMSDQIDGLRRQGISSCITINGMLSLPERHHALDRVRLGDAAIVLISPEQLRSPSVISVLQQREIGGWVIDEAHCLSKWGHDFRPDYRYLARVMRELAGDTPLPPVLCLTATAKPGVIQDIRDYFRSKLGIELGCVDGGALRTNLSFEVRSTTRQGKLQDVANIISDRLPSGDRSGAVVYCATRKATERVAAFLRGVGFEAGHFHAGLMPDTKREVQEQFRSGHLRVIAATSAFGMGIDKPDVRLVLHADMPGSLESYAQEAGRAGRDREPAACVLLYCNDDVEHQFDLIVRSRLQRREIGGVLKSVRRLDRRFKQDGLVVATPGEILKEDIDGAFARDSATDDTRAKTAIAWLEEAALLRRDENRVSIFPSSLRVRTVREAAARLAKADMKQSWRDALTGIVRTLIEAEPARGVSTDELAGVAQLSTLDLRRALRDLERLRIATDDTAITVFVHVGVENSSRRRLDAFASAELALIDALREAAPDLAHGERIQLNLRLVSHSLRECGHPGTRPDTVELLLRAIAGDGRNDAQGTGSLSVRKLDRECFGITLQRPWQALAQAAQLRRTGAEMLLRTLEDGVQAGKRGTDIEVETTVGTLIAVLDDDLQIRAEATDVTRLLDRCLLWMHELGIATLGKGLTVFRPAMTIRIAAENRRFTQSDYEPLAIHYDEQVRQIHIMSEYARRGLAGMPDALRLADDYFSMEEDEFLRKWLPQQLDSIDKPVTPATWRTIVEALEHSQQQRIVADDRVRTNVLVLAGPGSGKTRVLVHRIAYLIRVRRENPACILALAYNRHAANEIRSRLAALVGDQSKAVTILTCHALAMRIVGASFAARSDKTEPIDFDAVLREATALLRGDGLERDEAEAQRETLTRGYRWILVDEYQDIGKLEYELIAAIAGRSLDDPDSRLSLFAVGDDDQNIYAFAGASVEYIRRFEADYVARPVHLVENFRSTANIVRAANRVIARAAERMKSGHEITVNSARRREPAGGLLACVDSVGQGRVQVLPAGANELTQAVAAVGELERLSQLDLDWDWSSAAVIARNWRALEPVRSLCEARGIPVQLAIEDAPAFWRLRETQTLVRWLEAQSETVFELARLRDWLGAQGDGPWWALLREGVGELAGEIGGASVLVATLLDWLADWGRQLRRQQTGLLFLTAHRAKGLEFNDVVVVDGDWDRTSRGEDRDAPRRLYYVAMTRARRSLALAHFDRRHTILDGLLEDAAFLIRREKVNDIEVTDCTKRYLRLDPSQVDLGFAGRLPERSPTIDAISQLEPGAPVSIEAKGDRFFLLDSQGNTVGRLAKKFRAPAGCRFVRGQVFAAVEIRAKDSEEYYRGSLRRSRWEVIVPELVFTPVHTGVPDANVLRPSRE